MVEPRLFKGFARPMALVGLLNSRTKVDTGFSTVQAGLSLILAGDKNVLYLLCIRHFIKNVRRFKLKLSEVFWDTIICKAYCF